MGKEIAEHFPQARAIFEEADRILGFPLSTLCWEGPVQKLTQTEFCQPALYVTSMAVLAALNPAMKPAAAAGLSLGEYTALAAAGAISFSDGLRLVRLRGQAMEEAASLSPGTMASILGLDLPVIEEICAAAGAQVANINTPGQIVISGTKEAVEKASRQAKERGAKRAIPLEVGGAFHSRLMEPAAQRLAKALEEVPLREFQYPVASNVTGSFYESPSQIRTLLVEQLTHPVRWESCMRVLVQNGIRAFLEVGCGSVLKGLFRRIDPQVQVVSVGKAEEVRQAAGLLLS
jgi:[acyl-carrier-protein] S-malonyltransferase